MRGGRPVRFLVLALLLVVPLLSSSPQRAAAATPRAGELLATLVQDANKEGKLVATIQGSWNRDVAPKLADAFKRRFGLTIDISLTRVASANQFPLEIAATKAGGPPIYDVMQSADAETMQFNGQGGLQPIPRWEELLAAINPDVAAGKVKPGQISRGPLKGVSFLYMANVKEIIYNTKLMTESDLPKTHADLSSPKYAEKFVQPPWTSHWEMAPQVVRNHGRDKFLDVVRAAGKNTGAVFSESEGVQRVALGQYAFALAQDSYLGQVLSRDPQAPVAGAFFRDYNELNDVYYSVRTRTPHPAASALWALWMTTPEAEAIWQPLAHSFVPYGNSAIDNEERDVIRRNRAPVIGYLDNADTIALLLWEQTPEGNRYLSVMAKAIRGE
jgi:ABC-type Fe3+ transport system substrate-binding protein